jgi:putative ABC transport system ATP-binding protein
VVGNPGLLLADEPTGNLDRASGEAVMALLAELNADGTTVVVVTHDRDLAAKVPRQIEVSDGQIIRDEAS